jgi:hypothetical protein
MPDAHVSDADIDGWLNALGVTSLCQWDVLMFLYRHQTSLLGADAIARFLGYANGPVVEALDALEGLGLVARSRVSQVVRLYQSITPPDPPRSDAWACLLALVSRRAGRVRLSKRLQNGEPTRPGVALRELVLPGRGQVSRPGNQATVAHGQRGA